jgi:hypothetical protein
MYHLGLRVPSAWLGWSLAFALHAATPSPAVEWQARFPGVPSAIAVAADGDVVAAFPRPLPRYQVTAEVVKLRSRDGRARWRHRVQGTGRDRSDEILALVPTADGDVVAVGSVLDGGDGGDPVVVRLSRRTGRERWRRILRGRSPRQSGEVARAAALDPSGDVLVGGGLVNEVAPIAYADFTVAKLAGLTGAERWRFTLDSPDGAHFADVVAADAAGDVVAAGEVIGSSTPSVIVVKLAGATGALLWRRDLDIAWRSSSVAFDAAGDVVLALSTVEDEGNAFGVAKLAGASGELRWIARESGSTHRWQEAVRVVVDASGDVFAAGMINDGRGSAAQSEGYVFTAVRLDGVSGTRKWSYRNPGLDGGGFARAIHLDPAGVLFVGGSTTGGSTCQDGLLVALDAGAGGLLRSWTFDGAFVAADCRPDCFRSCPPVDDDAMTALAADGRGGLLVGLALLDRGPRGARPTRAIRRLALEPSRGARPAARHAPVHGAR